MNLHNVGPWISVNASEVLDARSSYVDDQGFKYSPSPYDVPVAVRIDEGDKKNPDYIVELKYIGGAENKFQKNDTLGGVHLETGVKSGRVYKVYVNSSSEADRINIVWVTDALKNSSQGPGSVSNVSLVIRAIEAHSEELSRQIFRLSA